ncbi:MAG: S8 family serine peptidase [Polaromonas sp.]|uniref:S8 family peptidase n=1 Tax=Polaromonas sp. TaxID=1869339 RepID=UPI0027315166|nr:S8 family serine peptidase [Polaromonas sp.]MDP2256659.1 S8 family serine peptidase [Polaromonas sp.]
MKTKKNFRPLGAAVMALSIATASALSIAQLAPEGKTFSKAQATAFAGPLQTERRLDRLIVKFKDKAVTRAGVFDFNAARSQVSMLQTGTALKSLNTSAANLSYLKSVTAETHVVITGQKLSRAELFALAKQIEQDASVAYAEIDEIVQPLFTPNDPQYQSQQWHYQTPATVPGGANLPTAWDLSTGSGAVVAVIDTGFRPHADLAANLLPGYDFVSDLTMANDGDGRDSDASDPGDWCGTDSPPSNSSWHGTHVAGTIAAVTNNGVGVAGVAFGAKVLPVRVLGVCGGHISDIAAGMRWSAGLSVPDVPANPNKAKVLNLSLGGSGSCSDTFQGAVNAARAVGSIVVAATGNDGKTVISQPANCAGVIAVTAHTKLGDNADYANIGAGTAISGPGGGAGTLVAGDGALVYSTLNTGTTTPVADSYAGYQGTSMAASHVAGVAALLASLQPAITPDTLGSVLASSARPHPPGTFCAPRTDCGAGLVDARAALDRLNSLAPTVAASVSPTGVRPTGSTISFTATASAGNSGNTTFSYQWTQMAGPAVSLSSTTAAATSFLAPSPGASYTFKVNVTDGAGLSASNQVSVRSNTAPVLSPIPVQSVIQGGNLSFTASAADAENNPVMFVANSLPAGSSFDAATGVFSWDAAGPAGDYSLTITPNDGIFSGIPQTVLIAVTASGAAGGGGGGGSMGWPDVLALLSLTALGVYFGRRYGPKR